ncbi:MAG: choice-of-anchor D domain-containing protein [bacterium]
MKKMNKAFTMIAIAALCIMCAGPAHAQLFPTVTITPDPLDCPDTRVGESSTTQTLTATRGAGSIPVLIFSTKLGDSANFSIQNDLCSNTVLENSGDSCTVDIVFSPQARSHYSTTFSLISISSDIIDSVLIEGTGVEPAVTLSVTSIDFGDQTVNKSSSAHQVTMLNSGNEALTIASIEASDGFAVTDDCGETLAEDASCNLSIVFSPTAEQQYDGSVTITDDASDSPQTISLTGTGIAAGQPDASLSKHLLEFGNQLIGTTSTAQTIVLTSTGTVDLAITSITASADFAVTHDCVTPLAPDAGCNLNITFTPPSTGNFTGTVLVTDDASDSPQTINLTGVGITVSGPQASFSTNLIDFGQVAINTSTAPQVLTLTNTGDENLVISDIALGGENPEHFSGTDDCESDTIAPSRSCSGAITFHPTQKGIFTATLNVYDNATGSPQVVSLTGIGIHSSGGCDLISGAPRMAPMGVTALVFAAALIRIARRRIG